MSVLLGNGDGTFQPQVTYAVRGRISAAIVAGDFNGDGRIDLAVTGYNDDSAPTPVGEVSVLSGNGDGTFQPQVTYDVGFYPTLIVAGDFTRRRPHRPGRASSNTLRHRHQWHVSVLLGNGDGTFQPPVTYAVGSRPGGYRGGRLQRRRPHRPGRRRLS